MMFSEFFKNHFSTGDKKQISLLEKVKEQRSQAGIPDRAAILKALERTRPYTKTVYPKDWSQQ